MKRTLLVLILCAAELLACSANAKRNRLASGLALVLPTQPITLLEGRAGEIGASLVNRGPSKVKYCIWRATLGLEYPNGEKTPMDLRTKFDSCGPVLELKSGEEHPLQLRSFVFTDPPANHATMFARVELQLDLGQFHSRNSFIELKASREVSIKAGSDSGHRDLPPNNSLERAGHRRVSLRSVLLRPAAQLKVR